MSKKITIIKSAFSLTMANIFTKVLNALAGIVLVNYFTLNDYGAYQTAFAYVAIFCVISDLGISQLLVRDGVRDKENFANLGNNALTLELILSILTFLLMLFGLVFTHYSKMTMLFVVLLAIGQVLIDSTFGPVLLSVFQVNDKLDVSSYITILQCIFNAALIFCFAYFKLSVLSFILIFPTASIVFLFVKLWFARGYYKFKFILDIKKMKYIMLESIPYGVSSVAAYLYLQSGTVILSLMMAERYTGIYSAAFKLILITYTIPSIIYISLMNKMFSYGSSNVEVFKKYYNTLFKFLLPIGLFLSLNFMYFSNNIILLLYKKKLAEAIVPFKYLSVLVLLEFINYPPASILTFTDRQKVKSTIQCIIAVINVIFNIVFIKLFGMIGVVYSIILTDTLKNILWYVFAFKYGYRISWIKEYFYLMVSLIIVFSFYTLLYNKINFIILGTIGTVIFIAILFMFKYIKKEDIRLR